MTSREFNHDPSGAKRSADAGPVLITHRGEVSHVLLAIRDYRSLSGGGQSLVELLGMKEDDVEFEPGRASITLRPTDLS